jgi:hypothetical protein
VAAEASRRREEHRLVGAAVARMRGRGKSVSAIAALAQTAESDVRVYLKFVGAVGAEWRRTTRRESWRQREDAPAVFDVIEFAGPGTLLRQQVPFGSH